MRRNQARQTNQPPLCPNCVHYYITYDRIRPHGCRTMGFASRELPAKVVYASSGFACQRYQAKSHPTAVAKEGRKSDIPAIVQENFTQRNLEKKEGHSIEIIA